MSESLTPPPNPLQIVGTRVGSSTEYRVLCTACTWRPIKKFESAGNASEFARTHEHSPFYGKDV